jgi:hypothetical protein
MLVVWGCLRRSLGPQFGRDDGRVVDCRVLEIVHCCGVAVVEGEG